MTANWTPEDHERAILKARELYDTDAHATNKCHSLTAELKRVDAQIAACGGTHRFKVLTVAETGEIVARSVRSFPHPRGWGRSVVWSVSRERFGRSTIPMGERSRIQKQLGLVEGVEEAPAYAELAGGGNGFAGLTSCYVQIFREDHECLGELAL